MNITRNENYEREIYRSLRTDLESAPRNPSDIHVSDLLHPRFSYFCKVLGTPDLGEKEVGYFVSGRAFHEYLQRAVFSDDLVEEKGEYLGVIATVDVLGDIVTEIKTSRKYSVPDEPEKRHVRQLSYYMGIFNKLIGCLLVVYFTAGRSLANNKTSSLVLRAWEFRSTEQELIDIRKEIDGVKKILVNSMLTKDFSKLPLCETWMCGSVYNNKIESLCPFYEKCKPLGRYPEERLIDLNKKVYKRVSNDKRAGTKD